MRYVIILLLLIMCGCAAVNVTDSYINPVFNQKLDKIAIKWEPLKEYDFTFQHKTSTSNGMHISINKSGEINKAADHIKDIGKRYPVLLAKELLHYDTDIVNKSEANYELITATGSEVHISCKSTGCSSRVTVEFTLKDMKSDETVWSSVMTVRSARHPYWERPADSKIEMLTNDRTKELAETIVKEWEKHKLLSARSDKPRVAPAGSIASQNVKVGTTVQLKNLPSGDITATPANPDYINKKDSDD